MSQKIKTKSLTWFSHVCPPLWAKSIYILHRIPIILSVAHIRLIGPTNENQLPRHRLVPWPSMFRVVSGVNVDQILHAWRQLIHHLPPWGEKTRYAPPTTPRVNVGSRRDQTTVTRRPRGSNPSRVRVQPVLKLIPEGALTEVRAPGPQHRAAGYGAAPRFMAGSADP